MPGTLGGLRRFATSPHFNPPRDQALISADDPHIFPSFPTDRVSRPASHNTSGLTDRLQTITEHGPAGQQRLQTFIRVKEALEGDHIKLQPQGQMPARGLGGRLNALISKIRPPPSRLDQQQEKEMLLREFHNKAGKRKQDGLVHLETFKKVLKVKGEDFAGLLFSALDTDQRGCVTDEQLISTLLDLQRGTPAEKIAFIWSFVATSENEITRSQLGELIKASCFESQINLDPLAVDGLAEAFFNRAGKAHESTLTLRDFTQVLESRPELGESLQFGGLDLSAAMARQEVGEAVKPLPLLERWSAKTLQWLKVDDFAFLFWMTLIILGQLAGFAAGMVQYSMYSTKGFSYDGWTYPIAKGAGRSMQVLFILFPFTVARGFLTFLRTTPLAVLFPLDDHLKFHSYLAYQFAFWGTLHTICHIINAARQSESSRYHRADIPFAPTPKADGDGIIKGLGQTQAQYYADEVQVTGILLCFFLLLGFTFALPYPKGSVFLKKHFNRLSKFLSNFELFFITHIIMAVTVLVLLIIHPYPNKLRNLKAEDVDGTPVEGSSWVYLLAGTVVYLLERIARIFKSALWSTDVLEVVLHPGKVTELKLRKPGRIYNSYSTFNGKPGQYCFLKVPSLASFEWHPFSLTSSTHDDFISFHIQALGDWTTSLNKKCEKLYEARPKQDSLSTQELPYENSQRKLIMPPFVVQVDGPCGAPAQRYSDFKVLLLVGANIGVTPFAAVLRQLVEEIRQSKCDHCQAANSKIFKTRRVYFYWCTREREAPRFFQQVLQEIAGFQPDFLEVNIYLTNALPANDLRVTMGRIAQLIQHEDGDGFDAVSGAYQPTPVYFGRPKWPKVFQQIRKDNPGSKVGVFVCGPQVLSTPLKGVCIQQNKLSLSDDPVSTQFVFHKENF